MTLGVNQHEYTLNKNKPNFLPVVYARDDKLQDGWWLPCDAAWVAWAGWAAPCCCKTAVTEALRVVRQRREEEAQTLTQNWSLEKPKKLSSCWKLQQLTTPGSCRLLTKGGSRCFSKPPRSCSSRTRCLNHPPWIQG